MKSILQIHQAVTLLKIDSNQRQIAYPVILPILLSCQYDLCVQRRLLFGIDSQFGDRTGDALAVALALLLELVERGDRDALGVDFEVAAQRGRGSRCGPCRRCPGRTGRRAPRG